MFIWSNRNNEFADTHKWSKNKWYIWLKILFYATLLFLTFPSTSLHPYLLVNFVFLLEDRKLHWNLQPHKSKTFLALRLQQSISFKLFSNTEGRFFFYSSRLFPSFITSNGITRNAWTFWGRKGPVYFWSAKNLLENVRLLNVTENVYKGWGICVFKVALVKKNFQKHIKKKFYCR